MMMQQFFIESTMLLVLEMSQNKMHFAAGVPIREKSRGRKTSACKAIFRFFRLNLLSKKENMI